MKKLKSIFFREEIIIPFIILIVLSLSAIPQVKYFISAPPDTVYTFGFNYIPDFNQYIAFMKDGADGNFLMTFRSSPDNFPKYPLYLFYLTSGFILGKLGINLFFGHFLLRIMTAFVLLVSIHQLLINVFPRSSRWRILGFLLIVSTYPLYHWPPFYSYFPNMTSINPLIRNLFLPHNSLGVALMIFVVIRFHHWLKNHQPYRQLIVPAILLLAVVSLNPAMFAVFSFYLGLTGIIYVLFNFNAWRRMVIGAIILGSLAVPAFIYSQYIFTHVLPFSYHFASQSSTNYNIGVREYFLVCGPLLFLAISNMLLEVGNWVWKRGKRLESSFWKVENGNGKKKLDNRNKSNFQSLFSIANFHTPTTNFHFPNSSTNFLTILIIIWSFAPLLLFQILAKVIPLSQERIFETFFYIPIGILAANTLSRIPFRLIKISIVTILVMAAIPYYYYTMGQLLTEFQPNFMNVFVPKTTVKAFQWLDKNSPDESVVAAGYFSGNLLTAFSHNRAVFGHDASTYRGKDRWAELMVIYSDDSTPQQIIKTMEQENIRYILFTPDSIRYDQTNLVSVDNLKLVFANNGNAVYEFISPSK